MDALLGGSHPRLAAPHRHESLDLVSTLWNREERKF